MPTLYVIHAEGSERDGRALHKIGITSNGPEKRLKALQTANPHRLTLAAAVACANPAQIERELHAHFDEHRQAGEWFALTPEDVTEAVGLAEAYAAENPPLPPAAPEPAVSTLPSTISHGRVEDLGDGVELHLPACMDQLVCVGEQELITIDFGPGQRHTFKTRMYAPPGIDRTLVPALMEKYRLAMLGSREALEDGRRLAEIALGRSLPPVEEPEPGAPTPMDLLYRYAKGSGFSSQNSGEAG
ncbi:MAG TPA: GIY-YIG nuclease family protein [Anaeromyxobacteraceae bacterium]|nr:GIY-YIG nuclease family protein [Anaeromyxobacteraceae bacterium]